METRHKIRQRMNELSEKVGVVDEAMSAEMAKPFYKRRLTLLSFLYKEQSVYKFALAELEKLLEERPGNE